jgi:copper transport protein
MVRYVPILGIALLLGPAIHSASTFAAPSELPGAGSEAFSPTSPSESHTRLERSFPGEGDSLSEAPTEAELEFSAAVELSLTRLVLRYATGDSVLLNPTAVPGAAHRIRAALPELQPGRFWIDWATVSVDGHRVNGTIRFTLLGDSELAARAGGSEEERDEAAVEPSPLVEAQDGTTDGTDSPPLRRTLFRGIGLFCLLAAAGVLWFAGGSGLVREPSVLRAASATALLATVLLGLDYLDWLLDVRPTDLGLFAGFAAAFRTRIGLVEGLRVLLAGLTFFLAGGARAGRLAGFVAMVGVVIGAASGHSALIEPALALPANALHLGAAAIWIGGVLLLTVLPDHPETPQGGWSYPEVAGRVSSRAFLAVGIIVGSAILLDLLFLGSVENLVSTAYGRILLGKGAGFTVLLGFGAWHRWKTLPRLVATGDQSHLRLAVRIEIFVLTAVVVLAAWLAMVQPPSTG